MFEGSRRYLVAAARAGLRRAVVFSCANTAEVLTVSGLAPLVELTVDGVTIHAERLWGKPAPDTFLAAVKGLGRGRCSARWSRTRSLVLPRGRAGHFGYVLGVDRVEQGEGLRGHGADTVVGDLAELLDRS